MIYYKRQRTLETQNIQESLELQNNFKLRLLLHGKAPKYEYRAKKVKYKSNTNMVSGICSYDCL